MARPMSKQMRTVNNSVSRFVSRCERFTVDDVRRGTKKNRKAVRAALNRLYVQGKIQKVDSVKTGGRGRPKAIYTVKDGSNAH